MSRETGWLIERGDSTDNSPIWWTGVCIGNRIGPWSPESTEAVRFCREQDAKATVASMLFDHIAPQSYGSLRVTEHIWMEKGGGSNRPAQTNEGGHIAQPARGTDTPAPAPDKALVEALEAAKVALNMAANDAYDRGDEELRHRCAKACNDVAHALAAARKEALSPDRTEP